MSDSEHGHGAHEIDNMPNRRLFNLLFGLSALTLLACIGVVQLFNRQLDQIQDQRGDQGSFQLAEYREELARLKSTWGVVEIVEDDGLPKPKQIANAGPTTAPRYHMPVSEAKRRVLADPKALAAPPAYTGWEQQVWNEKPVNKTDAGAAPAAPTPTPGVRPAPGQPGQPAPGQPAPGVRPAPGQPGQPAPGQPAPGQPAPEGKAPTAPRPVPTPAPEGKAPAPEGKAPAAPRPPKPPEGKAPAAPKPPEGKAAPADGKAEGKADAKAGG